MREATGEGQHIDMALFDTQISVLANQNLNYLVSGKAPVQMGNAHPNIAPYEVLPVADGHFILAVGNDGQFRKFCQVVGLDALPDDPDFRHQRRPRRQPHRAAAADGSGADDIRTRRAAGEAGRGRRAGLADQHDRRRFRRPAGHRARHAHRPRRRPWQHPALGARADGDVGTPLTYDRPSPRLGEHTAEILAELEGKS